MALEKGTEWRPFESKREGEGMVVSRSGLGLVLVGEWRGRRSNGLLEERKKQSFQNGLFLEVFL